jgi:hypothetical protein
VSDEQSGRGRLLEALHVRRNARRGFGVALVATLLLYAVFVAEPVLRGEALTRGAWSWYVGLGLSMFLGMGALVTTVLVAIRARRLVREL